MQPRGQPLSYSNLDIIPNNKYERLVNFYSTGMYCGVHDIMKPLVFNPAEGTKQPEIAFTIQVAERCKVWEINK